MHNRLAKLGRPGVWAMAAAFPLPLLGASLTSAARQHPVPQYRPDCHNHGGPCDSVAFEVSNAIQARADAASTQAMLNRRQAGMITPPGADAGLVGPRYGFAADSQLRTFESFIL